MEGDKTTVLPLAPTPFSKKGEFRFKRVSERAREEKEQERHPFWLYFDDSLLFRFSVRWW